MFEILIDKINPLFWLITLVVFHGATYLHQPYSSARAASSRENMQILAVLVTEKAGNNTLHVQFERFFRNHRSQAVVEKHVQLTQSKFIFLLTQS